MGKLRKRELEKIWKQLDGCCEALEKLEEDGIESSVDATAIVALKSQVEEIIEGKARRAN